MVPSWERNKMYQAIWIFKWCLPSFCFWQCMQGPSYSLFFLHFIFSFSVSSWSCWFCELTSWCQYQPKRKSIWLDKTNVYSQPKWRGWRVWKSWHQLGQLIMCLLGPDLNDVWSTLTRNMNDSKQTISLL